MTTKMCPEMISSLFGDVKWTKTRLDELSARDCMRKGQRVGALCDDSNMKSP